MPVSARKGSTRIYVNLTKPPYEVRIVSKSQDAIPRELGHVRESIIRGFENYRKKCRRRKEDFRSYVPKPRG